MCIRDRNTGAYGFSSMAAAIMGLWYGILSFTEDDCNYILARIGMALEGDVYKRQTKMSVSKLRENLETV